MKRLEQILKKQQPPVGHLQCENEDVIKSVKKWLEGINKEHIFKASAWEYAMDELNRSEQK